MRISDNIDDCPVPSKFAPYPHTSDLAYPATNEFAEDHINRTAESKLRNPFPPENYGMQFAEVNALKPPSGLVERSKPDFAGRCSCNQQSVPETPTEVKKSIEIVRRILDELVTTERSYCRSLYVFSEVVAKNVCTKSGVSLKELRLLFPRCLPDLYAMHVEMLERMEADMKATGTSCGQVCKLDCVRPPFIVLLESLERKTLKHITSVDWSQGGEPHDSRFFVLYQRYFSEFTVAMETMHKLTRQSSRFRQTVKRLQQHPDCEGFDFSAFLLAPVQRLPRYLLLIKQLTRHFRKLADSLVWIGDTLSNVALSLSEQCEKHLHTILVYLDAQLAEHRQQPKVKTPAPSRASSREPNRTNAVVHNANGDHSGSNPSNRTETGTEALKGIWPRVRRAFSDKRTNPSGEEPKQGASPSGREPLENACSGPTPSVRDESTVLDHSPPQSYDNAVPIGRFLVSHRSEDDLLDAEKLPSISSRSNVQRLILVENPVQELISCVTAGTISAAVRRNSRRQTVGEVTAAMQNALQSTKLKHLSLDRQCFSPIPHGSDSLAFCDNSREASVNPQAEDVSPYPVSPSSANSSACPLHPQVSTEDEMEDDEVACSAQSEVENPPRIGKKVGRVNTFPSRRFPFLRLQRRQSEPLSARNKKESNIPVIQEICSEPAVEDEELVYKLHSIEAGVSLSSSSSRPSGTNDSHIVDTPSSRCSIQPESTHATESPNLPQSANGQVPKSICRAVSQPQEVSDKEAIQKKKYRQSLPPIYLTMPESTVSGILENDESTSIQAQSNCSIDSSTPDNPDTVLKKTINSWRNVLRNFFRRKSDKKYNRSHMNSGSVKANSEMFSECYIHFGINPNEETAPPSVVESSFASNHIRNNAIGHVMVQRSNITDHMTKNDTDLNRTEYCGQTDSELLSNASKATEDALKLPPEFGHLVFLDETGNLCFDI